MSPSESNEARYILTKYEGQEFITVYVAGKDPLSTDDSNPNFERIVAGARRGEDVIGLFDLARTIREKLIVLSDRAAVRYGTVYFDGVEQRGPIVEKIVQYLDQGVEDWKPLVSFMDKVAQNPNPDSRESLYAWLKAAKGYDITAEGDIVGYKGVETVRPQGFRSCNAGTAFVNEEEHVGHIPQEVGDVVTMPRDQVDDNQGTSCSSGLHVATKRYAKMFGDVTLRVGVNPRDVVAVPTGEHDKVRVCRYEVLSVEVER